MHLLLHLLFSLANSRERNDKHCIKQTSMSDGKQIDNQQEWYTILLQSSHIERENNTDPAYLEPISNVYEEIESNAETVN